MPRHAPAILDASCGWKAKRVWRSAAYSYIAIKRLQRLEMESPASPRSSTSSDGGDDCFANPVSQAAAGAIGECYSEVVTAIRALFTSMTQCTCAIPKKSCMGSWCREYRVFDAESINYDTVGDILEGIFFTMDGHSELTDNLKEGNDYDKHEPELLSACSDLCASVPMRSRLELCRALRIDVNSKVALITQRPVSKSPTGLAGAALRLCSSVPSDSPLARDSDSRGSLDSVRPASIDEPRPSSSGLGLGLRHQRGFSFDSSELGHGGEGWVPPSKTALPAGGLSHAASLGTLMDAHVVKQGARADAGAGAGEGGREAPWLVNREELSSPRGGRLLDSLRCKDSRGAAGKSRLGGSVPSSPTATLPARDRKHTAVS